MQQNILNTQIEFLKGVGPNRADLLKKELHIFTYRDLLYHFPFRYVDRSKYYRISEIQSTDAEVQIEGWITKIEEVGKNRAKRLVAYFQDETGIVELVWFAGIRWIKPNLKINVPYVLFGKPSIFNNRLNFTHPELELKSEVQQSLQSGLQPVYRSTEKLNSKGLHSKGISKLTKVLLPQLINQIDETITDDIKNKYKLINKEKAIFDVHFPTDIESLKLARYRLKFEEFFFIQLSLINQRNLHNRSIKGQVFKTVGSSFNDFYNEKLPFTLTNAQKRVLKEIRKNVNTGEHMNRLVQGDVGSGKTIVALMSMLIAKDNGFQSCMMAPTEILANQHFQGLKDDLGDLPVRVELLTGSVKSKDRKPLLEDLKGGEIDILVGTHALIEDPVVFHKLGLVVIDEQHRFGVAQREKLWRKGELGTNGLIPPHILIMTATPIPRTLAMSVYGDLDISVIDELPPGRKPINTIHRFDSNRLKVFAFLKQEIAKKRQVYIVYPLIEESSKLDYKNLMDGFESISRAFPLPEYAVSIVHGKMKPEDKNYEMQRFIKGETDIMIATTVIEVGVNVPNASVMVIESAERFGLSQLHQLRGRVGRGSEKSYCILITGIKLSEEAKTRMSTMVRTNDGFEVAEVDLKLRGPGDIMGTRQSGLPDLKIGDLVKDGPILSTARTAASDLLKADPKLSTPANLIIRNEFLKKNKENLRWSRIS